jgi:opacity protein-like surface antigen
MTARFRAEESMLRLILALPLVCLCGQVVFAQSPYLLEHRQWEFSGFAGGSFMSGEDEFVTQVRDNGTALTTRTVGLRYASGYQIGMRVGENLGDFWTADLEYSFANQPLTFTNLSPTIQSLSVGQFVHHWSYSISYSPASRLKRFRPYAKIGTGATLFFLHGENKELAFQQGLRLQDTWKFLVNWGGGAKYLVHDQVALMFDVKNNMTGVPNYGLPKSASIVNGVFFPGMARHGTLNNWQLNFGIAYQWDEGY